MTILGQVTAQNTLAVREGGAFGAYGTINEAYAAANAGDIIVVEPKSGGRAYLESISIDKAITLTTETEGVNFTVEGSIEVAPVSDTVIISHLTLSGTNDHITSTADGTSSQDRTILKILSVDVNDLSFDHDNFDLTVVNSDIDKLTFRSGLIVGNKINSVVVTDELNPGTKSRERIELIGNRVTGGQTVGIDVKSDDYFFSINNNYIKADQSAIRIDGVWRNDDSEASEIMNNSIEMTYYSSTRYLIRNIDQPSNSVLNIYSNLMDAYTTSPSSYMFYETGVSGISDFQFNVGDDDVSIIHRQESTNMPDGTNVELTQEFVFDADYNSSSGVDLGHTETIYSDTDLTRNDAGCYGGSQTMTNYWPSDSSKPRVFSVKIPRRVRVGETIQVKAEAVDN